jgi:2-C-methyl-D-erythritol 4-phosphate cytidylyltransferase
MSCVAIIVAAGSGKRMGFDKLMAKIAGTSVLQRSLDAFLAAKEVHCVVVVTDAERFATLDCSGDKVVHRVDGGAERYLSVIEGLRAAAEDHTEIAIHDGARPLVRPEQIDECILKARQHGAAALARRVTETLKKADSENLSQSSVSRDHLWFMETPQIFRKDLISRAYEAVTNQQLPVTDDVSAAEAIGVQTRLIENPFPNPKITTPSDLPLAEALLAAE